MTEIQKINKSLFKLIFINICAIPSTLISSNTNQLSSIAEFHQTWNDQHKRYTMPHNKYQFYRNTSSYPLEYSPDKDGRFFLNLYENRAPFQANSWSTADGLDQIRIHITKEIPVRQLDEAVSKDGSSIGHVALRNKDLPLFRLWLNRGALCTAITDDKSPQEMHRRETILSLLCIKGLDFDPELQYLINQVIQRNRNLLFHMHFYNNKYISCPYTISKNKHLDDNTTREILQLFSDNGYDFTKEPLLIEMIKNMSLEKPLSTQYVISLLKTSNPSQDAALPTSLQVAGGGAAARPAEQP